MTHNRTPFSPNASRFIAAALVAGMATPFAFAQTPAHGTAKTKATVIPTTPAILVRDLYQRHNQGRGPVFGKEARTYLGRYFDPALSALIWKNIVGPPSGDVGNLDFDPLFYTQEVEISDLKIGPVLAGKARGDSSVAVTFRNSGKPHRFLFRLRKVGGAWKIRDLDYGDGQSLVTLLSRPF